MLLNRLWRLAQIVVPVFFGILTFQGKGSHGVFILGCLVLPLLRFALGPSYRTQVLTWFRSARAQLLDSQRSPSVRAVMGVIVCPFLVLVLANGGTVTSQDNLPLKLTAAALLTEGTVKLDPFFPQGCRNAEASLYFVACVQGHVVSKYPLGMLTFLLPVAAVGRVLGADMKDSRVQLRLEKWTASLVAALCLALFFLCARQLGPPTGALLATVFLGVGSSLFSIVGQGLWSQGGVTLGLLVLVSGELLGSPKTQARWTLLQGIALATMVACRISAVVPALPLCLWIFYRHPSRSLRVALVAVLAYVPWALVHQSFYGHPLGPQFLLTSGHYWTESPLGPFLGLTVGPSHGLLIYQPWLLLALWGRSGATRGTFPPLGKATLWGSALLLFGVLSFWEAWHGGSSWGSRLLAPVIPLFGLLAVPALARAWESHRNLTLGVLAIAFWVQVGCIYARGTLWYVEVLGAGTDSPLLWSWANAPFLYPILR